MTKPVTPLDVRALDALLADRDDSITAHMRITDAADLLAAEGYTEAAWDRFITVLADVVGKDEARSIVWGMVREA